MMITQQNRKCWLCGDRDETVNHIISGSSKLTHIIQGGQGDLLGVVQ